MANAFEKRFVPGALRVPERMPVRAFRASRDFEAPAELILTGYCTPVDDQGRNPWCAAYSAANFAENILWRKRGWRAEIDPGPLYGYAKTVDGDPDGDGTYLECTLKALLHYGHFDPDVCRIRTFGGGMFDNLDAVRDMRFAVHRYGVCMAGFDITSEWFSPKRGVVTGEKSERQGGHAVLVVGYDPDGFVIQNSWGPGYAHGGFVYLANRAFADQFMYGALLTHALDGLN